MPVVLLTYWARDKIAAYFADDIFECIFSNENVWISIKMLLKFAPKGLINHIAASVQIMARRQDIIWTMMDSLLLCGKIMFWRRRFESCKCRKTNYPLRWQIFRNYENEIILMLRFSHASV